MKQGILLLVLLALICFMKPFAHADITSSPATATVQAGAEKLNSPQATNGMEQKTAPTLSGTKSETKKEAAPQLGNTGCSKGIIITISLIPSVLFVIFLLIVKGVLRKNNWSLAEALSESETTTGPDGTPVFARSASRFMAFIGFFAIILWIVGLSIPTLYRMMCDGEIPDLGKVSTFLLAQAGIFAPYIVNKLAGALTNKTTP